jgi:hypothetical protein
MTDAEFQKRVSSPAALFFREDFQTALYDLYKAATPEHRDVLRQEHRAGNLRGPTTWRNPADYERSDLTREQHIRERLIAMSIDGAGHDYRDDLMAIAHCYHNLAVLGVDADTVLEELAMLSDEDFARLILNFVRRSPDGKSMKAFGLELVQTPNGPIADFSL